MRSSNIASLALFFVMACSGNSKFQGASNSVQDNPAADGNSANAVPATATQSGTDNTSQNASDQTTTNSNTNAENQLSGSNVNILSAGAATNGSGDGSNGSGATNANDASGTVNNGGVDGSNGTTLNGQAVNGNTLNANQITRAKCEGGKLIDGHCYYRATAGMSCTNYCAQNGFGGIDNFGMNHLMETYSYTYGPGISATGTWCSKIGTQFQSGSCTDPSGCGSNASAERNMMPTKLGCYFIFSTGQNQVLYYGSENDPASASSGTLRMCSCLN